MGAKRPLFRITPSNINDLVCAKKFHILRELGQWPPRTNNHGVKFGLAFHQLVRDVYDPMNGPPPNLQYLPFYAKQAFFAARYLDAATREMDIERGMSMIRTYVGNDDEEDIKGTIAVEQFGSFTVYQRNKPICILSARLDRVLVRASDPTRLVVRDCKTSRPRIDLKEAFVQLWVARYLYPSYEKLDLEIDWIDADGRVERDIIHSSDLKGIRFLTTSRILSYASRTDYPAEPGEACTFCPLRPECQPIKAVSIEPMEGIDEAL